MNPQQCLICAFHLILFKRPLVVLIKTAAVLKFDFVLIAFKPRFFYYIGKKILNL